MASHSSDISAQNVDALSDCTSEAEVIAPTQALEPLEAVSGQKEANLQEDTEVIGPEIIGTWVSDEKGKREIPKATKVGAGLVFALVVLVVALPKVTRSESQDKSISMIAVPTVEDSEDLKKRRTVTDDDFRVRGSTFVPQTKARLTDLEGGFDLETRRLKRGDNPEDLRTQKKKKRRHTGASRRRKVSQSAPKKLKSPWKFNPAFLNQESSPTSGSGAFREGQLLLPAASTVAVELNNDVIIRRGRTTVIARVKGNQALPKGTKLIGQASGVDAGLVSIRFTSIVLPSGDQIKARGEAVDAETESPDLLAAVSGGSAPRKERGVARDVGVSVADGLAGTLLGSGIVGDAARRGISGSDRANSRRISRRESVVVTLSKDTSLKALFLQDVVMEKD